MEINDGSSFKSLQVVFESAKVENYKDIVKLNVGAAVRVTGTFILTPQANQPFELNASSVEVEGQSTPDYPLQKKRHTLEYMRTIAHLRPRANIYSAAFRVRSTAAYAIHKFFNELGFIYAHTPLISCSDCEGAGEMFKVTTLDIANSPKNEDGPSISSRISSRSPLILPSPVSLRARLWLLLSARYIPSAPPSEPRSPILSATLRSSG